MTSYHIFITLRLINITSTSGRNTLWHNPTAFSPQNFYLVVVQVLGKKKKKKVSLLRFGALEKDKNGSSPNFLSCGGSGKAAARVMFIATFIDIFNGLTKCVLRMEYINYKYIIYKY